MEKLPLSAPARQCLVDNLDTLLKLYEQGKDTVWLFILKNMPRPRFLEQAFDLVAGNPPWLSLRYIADPTYSREVKRLALKTYHLLAPGKTHLFTHLDLAPLFFLQAARLYLKSSGSIAFVMPRGVLSADQYAYFTSFDFLGDEPISLALEQVVDLAPVPKEREVAPLFRQAACVLLARKGGTTAWPASATQMEGRLAGRNLPWAQAQKELKLTPTRLERVGGRLLTKGQAARSQARSYYYNRVFEGATLVPRNLLFVRAAAQPGPLACPSLETDETEARLAKPPWQEIRMRGAVEAPFIFATLLGGDILPFGHASLRPVVLPATIQEGRPILLNYNTAVEQGYTGLADWLKEAEAHWQEHAKRDERGEPKIPTLLERMNYRHMLTRQRVRGGYKVLYNSSGTHLAACVLDLAALGQVNLGSAVALAPAGLVVESKAYYIEVDSKDEAHYLAAVLNSAGLDLDLKPLQSRGQYGERDFHKKPFLFSIPRYDLSQPSHRRLVELGEACAQRVAAALPGLLAKYRGSGPLRSRIRELLAEELKTIDWHVRRIL